MEKPCSKNAGVSVVVVGVTSNPGIRHAAIFDDSQMINVKSINAYLISGAECLSQPCRSSLSIE